ncbi:hypothetical protein Mal52_53570 [Symmachiella dynata]|uniref:Arc-like DNA binding domain-containing protein n=1 Tax=Symmachiella dynata TaxID=2527995 RepID=A0A517ZWN2_9PLAN|nr:hypothetical protein Mal52_53570 [Symmachiella dynata]
MLITSRRGASSLAKRDSFLLRADPQVLDAVRRWADDELRSINGQIEYLLRQALKEAGRLPGDKPTAEDKTQP